MAAPVFPALHRRLLLAAAILLTAGALALMALAQPPRGQIAGTCVEADTRRPLSNVLVSLDRDTSQDAPEKEGDLAVGAARNARGDTSLPAGWHQDSASDTGLDAAGKASAAKTDWLIHTNAQGQFSLRHIPAGRV